MRALLTSIAALALVACSSSTPQAAPPEAPPKVEPAPAKPEAKVKAHPGTIVFVDADGSKTTDPVAGIPESIAWATIDGVRIPVVRVVRTVTAAGQSEITRFGPDGAELDRTISAPPPPPPPK